MKKPDFILLPDILLRDDRSNEPERAIFPAVIQERLTVRSDLRVSDAPDIDNMIASRNRFK
jgi:hypothetical protein